MKIVYIKIIDDIQRFSLLNSTYPGYQPLHLKAIRLFRDNNVVYDMAWMVMWWKLKQFIFKTVRSVILFY